MAKLIEVKTTTGGEILINPDFIVGVMSNPPHVLICLSHPIGVGKTLGNVVPIAFDEFKRLEKILKDHPKED